MTIGKPETLSETPQHRLTWFYASGGGKHAKAMREHHPYLCSNPIKSEVVSRFEYELDATLIQANAYTNHHNPVVNHKSTYSVFHNLGDWSVHHSASRCAVANVYIPCVIHSSAAVLVGKSFFPGMIRPHCHVNRGTEIKSLCTFGTDVLVCLQWRS